MSRARPQRPELPALISQGEIDHLDNAIEIMRIVRATIWGIGTLIIVLFWVGVFTWALV